MGLTTNISLGVTVCSINFCIREAGLSHQYGCFADEFRIVSTAERREEGISFVLTDLSSNLLRITHDTVKHLSVANDSSQCVGFDLVLVVIEKRIRDDIVWDFGSIEVSEIGLWLAIVVTLNGN
jgi:hypothetical protein